MIKFIFTFLLLIFTVGCGPKNYLNESKEDKQKRMEWWTDAKFGMFIHWGAYSVPAGWYENEMVPGASEWIMDAAKIPVDVYEQFPKQFNPTEYDPYKWVKIAKQAGMKYIVITSKHHDGFCNWDSKVSNYDVVDFAPYKKDILKPLAEACRKEGIKLGFYYSIMDWHHPDENKENFTKYRDEYLIPQLTELLKEFPDLTILWFDGEWIDEWTEQQGKDLYNYLRNISPNILINNRIGKGRDGMQGMNKDTDAVGDFGTPEQEILETSSAFPWESCMTFNDSWGFKKGDDNWKSAETIIYNLVDIVSKGGNYLLNVGPTSKGIIPNESVERLEKVGEWMNLNSEGIYNTRPIKNYFEGDNIRFTKSKKSDLFYCFILDEPESKIINISYITPNENSKIYLLGYGTPLVYSADESSTIINLPESENQFNYPICLKITGKENKVVETPKVIINNEKIENTFLFQNEVEINFETINQNAEIRFTLDGSEPTANSTLFNSKIKLNETTLLKARAFNMGWISSPIDSIKLYKIKSVKEVNLKNSPSEKYENLGKLSLADGKRGSENYDDNTWLGFEGANFEATVDLGEIKKVNDITLGCLSNLNSWIFLPKKTSFFVSNDNQNFKKIKEINYEVLKTESQKSFVKDISARVNNKTRYIKVVAENIGECPVWHKGSGGKAWLFIDEIIVN